ncbi:ubiquinol-cytochrome c reductase complex assembly factor 6 isoform X1 [Phyllobates terribilis]|uniref:ubiquinol-cytochrome c reductase complex assembly factor 6 isoform X1 n=2 Tax=Phyllobates terribilis TaxID=111132 RepID=UPI003CCA70A2
MCCLHYPVIGINILPIHTSLQCATLGSSITMPAGVSWPQYLKMLSATIVSMFAGAEVVHRYYRPDLSVPEVPPKPGELRTELLGLQTKKENNQTS